MTVCVFDNVSGYFITDRTTQRGGVVAGEINKIAQVQAKGKVYTIAGAGVKWCINAVTEYLCDVILQGQNKDAREQLLAELDRSKDSFFDIFLVIHDLETKQTELFEYDDTLTPFKLAGDVNIIADTNVILGFRALYDYAEQHDHFPPTLNGMERVHKLISLLKLCDKFSTRVSAYTYGYGYVNVSRVKEEFKYVPRTNGDVPR